MHAVLVTRRGYWPLLTRDQWYKCMVNVSWDHVGPGTVWNGVVFIESSIYSYMEGYTPYAFLLFAHIEDLGIEELTPLHCLMLQMDRLNPPDIYDSPHLEYVNLDREVALVVMMLHDSRLASRLAYDILSSFDRPSITWIGEAYTPTHAVLKAFGLSL